MHQPELLAPRMYAVSEPADDSRGASRTAEGPSIVPFRGARILVDPGDPVAVVAAYRPLLRPHVAVAGLSAAALYGLPVPRRCGSLSAVHLAVRKEDVRPTGRGVSARIVPPQAFRTLVVDKTRVTTPALTWCLLARELTVAELVRFGDALVSDKPSYVGRRRDFVPLDQDDLRTAIHRWTGCTGVGKLREALPQIREHVASPPESDLRVFLASAGFDGLEVNTRVFDRGEYIGRPDLLDRARRVTFEYDGDGHRTDRETYQQDVYRNERFARAGYTTVHVLADDLYRHRARLRGRAEDAYQRAARALTGRS